MVLFSQAVLLDLSFHDGDLSMTFARGSVGGNLRGYKVEMDNIS
jgi:hypothetical protein